MVVCAATRTGQVPIHSSIVVVSPVTLISTAADWYTSQVRAVKGLIRCLMVVSGGVLGTQTRRSTPARISFLSVSIGGSSATRLTLIAERLGVICCQALSFCVLRSTTSLPVCRLTWCLESG